MSCVCAIRLAVLARSRLDDVLCSAHCKVSVGAVHVGNVSDLTEFLEAPFGSFCEGPCYRRPGLFA